MEKDSLFTEIVSTTTAPRIMLVMYLRDMAEEARDMPKANLLTRSGTSQFRKAESSGELLAANVHHALVMQDNLPPDLEEIATIAQELGSYTDDPKLWEVLLQKIDQL